MNRCLYWFHPLAWFLPRTLASLSEHACDDRAIGLTGQRSPYARQLLDVATELTALRGRVRLGSISMAGASELSARIEAILDQSRTLSGPLTRRSTVILIGVAVPLVGAMAMLGMGRKIQAASPAAPSGDESTTRIEGRIIDLEGRPVPGAKVSVKFVQSPPGGNLDTWIDEIRRLGKQPVGLHIISTGSQHPEYSPTTGGDGRFRIDGMPRDAVATASITGPGIETAEVYILTRDLPTIRVKNAQSVDLKPLVYYGSRFDHVAAPTRPIIGTVRDKDSGAPISGVHITGMPNIPNSTITSPGIEATTDAQGRYQIDGLPVARGFKLFTEAPAGQPYVNCGFVSPAGELKPGPFTFDMGLKRGVLVRGHLTNKVTGEPVRGFVTYFAFQDNPHLQEFTNFKRESQVTRAPVSGSDGGFTIPALPGRGLVTARGPEEGYLHGRGADGIKGFDRQLGAFLTAPYYCSAADQHVVAEINPRPGENEITLELQVDPGRKVSGTIVGPDGQAVVGPVEIRTLDVFQMGQQTHANTSRFQVSGLPSGRYRLDFIDKQRKLAGALFLKGDEAENLTVTLQPWGTVVGRVVDDEGKPRTDVEIFSTIREHPDPERGDLEHKPTVDAQGRFRIEGLVPGVKYDALGHSPGKATGPILRGVQVGPGEVKDLGDVKLPTARKDQQ